MNTANKKSKDMTQISLSGQEEKIPLKPFSEEQYLQQHTKNAQKFLQISEEGSEKTITEISHQPKSEKWTGPRVDVTADIIVHDTANNMILLGRKEQDGELWRCPGGYSDVKDDDFVHTAQRELLEETELWFPISCFKYLGSYKVPDPRYVKRKDVIITSLYLVQTSVVLDPKAGDDLKEVKWFPLWGFVDKVHEHHRHLAIRAFEEIVWGNSQQIR